MNQVFFINNKYINIKNQIKSGEKRKRFTTVRKTKHTAIVDNANKFCFAFIGAIDLEIVKVKY